MIAAHDQKYRHPQPTHKTLNSCDETTWAVWQGGEMLYYFSVDRNNIFCALWPMTIEYNNHQNTLCTSYWGCSAWSFERSSGPVLICDTNTARLRDWGSVALPLSNIINSLFKAFWICTKWLFLFFLFDTRNDKPTHVAWEYNLIVHIILINDVIVVHKELS